MECHLYLAGIPSFKDAFTSSPIKQKIESLVSTLKSEGYDTLFHGAANGSMGF
jgi:hypothetical protein